MIKVTRNEKQLIVQSDFNGYLPSQAKKFGRMLHFIYHYCGLQFAENVIIGDKFITYYNKDFAKVEWKEIDFYNQKVIIPIFDFLHESKDYFHQNKN